MDKFKSFTQDGVTAELWAYDSLLVGARWGAFAALFDEDSPLASTSVFREFRAFCVYANALTFDETLAAAWAIELQKWWADAAPLVKNGRFDEAWELYGMMENNSEITVFFLRAWGETRRDIAPASEVITVGAASATDAGFLAAEAPTSKRSKKNT
jgi:hypothetical protein